MIYLFPKRNTLSGYRSVYNISSAACSLARSRSLARARSRSRSRSRSLARCRSPACSRSPARCGTATPWPVTAAFLACFHASGFFHHCSLVLGGPLIPSCSWDQAPCLSCRGASSSSSDQSKCPSCRGPPPSCPLRACKNVAGLKLAMCSTSPGCKPKLAGPGYTWQCAPCALRAGKR